MSSFRQVQYQFASHLRDPEQNPKPVGVDDRRMQVYRDLFYKNIENFLANGFPVLRKITGDEEWHRLVRGFYSQHKCQSPYFLDIGQEFIQYLQQERATEESDPPFLHELVHYEWIELALDIDEGEIPDSGYNSKGDLLRGRPVVSPLAWVLQYQFPVHRIGPTFIPGEAPPQPTFLIVYRNRDDQVKFMEINALTGRLFTLLQEHPNFTGSEALEQISSEISQLDRQTVMDGGRQALEHLREKEIILGTQLKQV